MSKKNKKIAIQGEFGAFHEIAALRYFKNEKVEIIPALTFKDLFKCLKDKKVDLGIMAIENSTAGSLLQNYTLLGNSTFHIIGEIYLRINQNVIALSGQTMKNIKEVYSHPMAILQCQEFFESYPSIKLIDSFDTALSAKEIKEKKIMGVAAIASLKAAKKYGLEVIAREVETNKMNYTRFLIISEKPNIHSGKINKASITFALEHKTGSLSKILSIFSFYGLNLSNIQSMPILGKDWEYQFYVDVLIDDYDIYKKSIEAIKPFTSNIKILGEYIKGEKVKE